MTKVAILTGGRDPWYAIPLSESLARQPQLEIELIASVEYLGAPALDRLGVPVLPVHGDLTPGQSRVRKAIRALRMYGGILAYAFRTDAQIFHLLWENQFKLLDRTLLVACYKLLGRKVVFTAHNVDADERDARGNALGRLSLRIMYAMADHVFVHTRRMKQQIGEKFGVESSRITVIPFGMNTVMPKSSMTCGDARRRLGYGDSTKLILFFGTLTAYKGIDYLIRALIALRNKGWSDWGLMIVGQVKDVSSQPYWAQVEQLIAEGGLTDVVKVQNRFIANEEAEQFFKAADACVLPYVTIDQSGVLILSFRYGTPVIVTDVGNMRDEVLPDNVGLVCRPRDPDHLADTLLEFFSSELHVNRQRHRGRIAAWAEAKYSWENIAPTIATTYRSLLTADRTTAAEIKKADGERTDVAG